MMSDLFPASTPSYVLAFQFSSWYPTFAKHSIKSTIVRPLSADFQEYLHADGVFVPEGSDNVPAESTLSDEEDAVEDDSEDEDAQPRRHYTFPDLDQRIRECIKEYEAVFPKLNFSSPKDASWLLPSSSPLKCMSPADVYLLLKSSDFINHDLSTESVFEGTKYDPSSSISPTYELELVLRKWYPVDRGRELRCFVRGDKLIGISQRDVNFYEFWNDTDTQAKVASAVSEFWETNIRPHWSAQPDYVFDFLLTRDLTRGHIIDFNPYMPKTDPLLFTYEELTDIFALSSSTKKDIPVLRVIDSASHPAAASNAPANQHNMLPVEAINMSSGRDIEEFADLWKQSVKESSS
ncbi:Cell division cycle protein 123 [Psilocybe cubensis]|uniref:Cell division cycle protein 123 n=2 Tax=Psilocybe cubensis TaxID=181762 RepID=A0ACB8GXI8_PSICU|nr:Cell division cycle protein 123 [Psilocybe cubensis]KAH9480460.1 Cell division cycle protein 123 [Psilocybe cubensis]